MWCFFPINKAGTIAPKGGHGKKRSGTSLSFGAFVFAVELSVELGVAFRP
jgi:hypothetical protein